MNAAISTGAAMSPGMTPKPTEKPAVPIGKALRGLPVRSALRFAFQYPITIPSIMNSITSARFSANSGALFLTHLK